MQVTRTGKWIYAITQGFTFLVVMALALIISGVGWLLLEPREIPLLSRQIEEALNPPNQPYTLTIGESVLSLGDWQYPLQVSIKTVELLDKRQRKLASIPAMHVSLGLWSFLGGKVMPEQITLIEPKLALKQAEDGIFFLSDREGDSVIPLHDLFAVAKPNQAPDANALFDSGVEELEIISGNVSFDSGLTKLKVRVPAVDVTIRQHAGVFRGRMEMHALQAGQKDTVIESYFTYAPATRDLFTRLEIKELIPADYAKLMPEFVAIEAIKTPVSGTIELKAALPMQLKQCSFNLKLGKGTIAYEPYFPKEVAILGLTAKAAIDGEKKTANLEDFHLLLDKEGELNASGQWAEDTEGKDSLKGQAKARNITKAKVMALWPEELAPQTRKWVDNSILKAKIPQAEFAIDAPPGSMAQWPMPDEILKLDLQIKQADVDYMPGFPIAKQADGQVVITGDALQAEIRKVQLLDNTLLNAEGKVSIPSLAADSMLINIVAPVTTDAPDVINFLKATPYKLPPQIRLNPAEIAGDLQGKVNVTVIDHTSPKVDDVTFEIDADVNNFYQPKFYKGMDLEAAKGKLIATDKKFSVDAEGIFDKQNTKIKAEITKDKEHYAVKTQASAEFLERYGIDVKPYITGEMGVNLDWTETAKGNATVSAQVDLKPAVIRIEDIDYTKSKGEAASLLLKGKAQQGVLHLSEFQFAIPERKEKVEGTASLRMDSGEIKEVNFTRFDFAGTKGSGVYRPIPGGHYLHARGEMLDLSYRDKEEELPVKSEDVPGPMPEEKEWEIPALDLQLDFDQVRMAKDAEKKLSSLKLEALCDTQICQRLNLEANAGKNAPFTMKIEREGNRRVFNAYTPRADILLRALNIFDDMQEGELQIVGVFQDELPQHPLVGKLTIGPHRVKNVPLLTKLLTVATFTGIVDALSGSGLMFQKLEAPFRKVGMNVYLQDAKTAGPSIGITAEGTLDFSRDKISLRGTVIPAYMFNALIRSIPVLGNVYGVLAGDGLVAMRYSMLGDIDNPDVTVNPLSALTPGFLRNFFTIFESPENKNAQNPQDVQKALEKMEKDLQHLQQDQKPAADAGVETEPKPSSQKPH